ncbi:MAG TPA: hypothetical protein VK085_10235 [Pseudogracilibacillus sp.]|nr:hypothetical protein [Pseudogracilibacillus sp.]
MSDKKLDLILKEIQFVKNDVQSMKNEMTSMKTETHAMKDELHSFKENMNFMKDEINSMKDNMNVMKDELHSFKDEMNIMKSQLDENTQLTKAIYHRQEESDAALESLSLDHAKIHEDIASVKQSISQISADQKSINELLGEHEISIRTLRRHTI